MTCLYIVTTTCQALFKCVTNINSVHFKSHSTVIVGTDDRQFPHLVETEAQRCSVSCPRLHSWCTHSWRWRHLDPGSGLFTRGCAASLTGDKVKLECQIPEDLKRLKCGLNPTR